jgi:hypothetical protein
VHADCSSTVAAIVLVKWVNVQPVSVEDLEGITGGCLTPTNPWRLEPVLMLRRIGLESSSHSYIYIIYTPNLGLTIAVFDREREQGRFNAAYHVTLDFFRDSKIPRRLCHLIQEAE